MIEEVEVVDKSGDDLLLRTFDGWLLVVVEQKVLPRVGDRVQLRDFVEVLP